MAGLAPVLCYSCGKVINNKLEDYEALLDDGYSDSDALDALDFHRYCCRRMLMTHTQHLFDKILSRVEAVTPSKTPIALNKEEENKELIRKRKGKQVRTIPHLCGGNCEPVDTIDEEVNLLKDIILPTDAPQKPYEPNTGKISTIKWGQRKLAITKLQFFTTYYNKDVSHTVLYVGAAPGTSIPFLSKLFPKFKWILVDPAPFHKSLKGLGNVTIVNGFFDDTMAATYEGKVGYFLSDIRSTAFTEGQDVTEIKIYQDMVAQMRWHEIIKPYKSHLKYRPPYADVRNRLPEAQRTFEYLKGTIYRQPWVGANSSETRLVPDEPPTYHVVDYKKYEDQLFYHNRIIRISAWLNHFAGEAGIDRCWDCSTECFILDAYLRRFYLNLTFPQRVTKVRQLTQELSASISQNYTLENPRNYITQQPEDEEDQE